ncbi:hypothetical protein G9C98_000898 [Cotesia typhae]|uniref:Uncharacterized protein n=1 Tax=Cotesia typhae TaxID=2053667 RepID=A0A8J5R4F7_9HYME|nr:hypothetical protein G9C98_000898 [Cotesia typhae]
MEEINRFGISRRHRLPDIPLQFRKRPQKGLHVPDRQAAERQRQGSQWVVTEQVRRAGTKSREYFGRAILQGMVAPLLSQDSQWRPQENSIPECRC